MQYGLITFVNFGRAYIITTPTSRIDIDGRNEDNIEIRISAGGASISFCQYEDRKIWAQIMEVCPASGEMHAYASWYLTYDHNGSATSRYSIDKERKRAGYSLGYIKTMTDGATSAEARNRGKTRKFIFDPMRIVMRSTDGEVVWKYESPILQTEAGVLDGLHNLGDFTITLKNGTVLRFVKGELATQSSQASHPIVSNISDIVTENSM